MKRPKVLLTEPITKDVQDFLEHFSDLKIGKRGHFITQEAVAEVIPEFDYLLCMLTTPVQKKVLEAGKKLKLVANFAVGYNNIDLKSATDLGILVCNTPDVLTEATADTTLALVLGVTRRVTEADKDLRNGLFDGWHPTSYLGLDFRNKQFGILGMGRIGKAVARRAKAFGFNIHYHNRSRLTEQVEKEFGAIYHHNADELVQISDVLSIHCPLTNDNHQYLNRERIHQMKKGSYIINTARGPIVDEEAIADALIEGHLAGAGFDVFEKEPTVHPKLLKAPNTLLLPHIGSATAETRSAIGMLAANAIYLHFKDQANTIPNRLN